MRIKEGVNIRKVGDSYIAVMENADTIDYTNVVSLNESAAQLLLQSQDRSFSPVYWVELLKEKYDVSHETASDDIQVLIELLLKAGVLEDK